MIDVLLEIAEEVAEAYCFFQSDGFVDSYRKEELAVGLSLLLVLMKRHNNSDYKRENKFNECSDCKRTEAVLVEGLVSDWSVYASLQNPDRRIIGTESKPIISLACMGGQVSSLPTPEKT